MKLFKYFSTIISIVMIILGIVACCNGDLVLCVADCAMAVSMANTATLINLMQRW